MHGRTIGIYILRMIDKSYIDRLKAIPITEYLADQGFVPAKQVGNQLVYLSPLTGEKTPSFFVHPDRNVFHCFSSGHKGDIITLVRQIEQLEFKQALVSLNSFQSSGNIITPSQSATVEERTVPFTKHQSAQNSQAHNSSSQIEILAVKTLSNRVLINYLHSRGIDAHLATVYLKEAYFRVQGKNLFALAFENDKGGYELRNPFYKGCAVLKAPTTIMGSTAVGQSAVYGYSSSSHSSGSYSANGAIQMNGAVNIFEGVFDFLSALTFYKIERFRNDSIILNSLWLFDPAYQTRLLNDYSEFSLFLDNDRAGWKKAIEFRNRAKTLLGTKTAIINQSSLYKSFKDFNEFLLSQ
ncbi:CHC2 zinc finger domain-containing protein [Cytophagaceae bacterium YF14B1]|uniref:CHC2 zinc finger domain-containing protein n=1 Tax=Xanthocytophaga flava TaxID=3048013 RepID=A0AAE3UAV6_9BACT|nr:CHC2 zinc finger domain-containing protein [Xanthocytophaga flavus]MDJ1485911.1 CHC2 zinc finger domain-containing protein [Xanthocytophaga flavus]